MKIQRYFLYAVLIAILQACGTYFLPPSNVEERSYIGEITATERNFDKLPDPLEKVVVGVYKFRDQTGQYKASETNVDWSTAVPQGLTSILIKSLEDSQWFVPVERENIGNLLNERQIIRTTRQEYSESGEAEKLPPLLFAGTLLEGGVISYDTNILTGGAGARYFGIGGSTEYRQDRITVYLRAVSTSSGKVLKTVYTSKTILSQSLNASMFRYVDPDRLMEAEIGVTNNEPVHMAVTEAINKAVYLMVLEGLQNGLWRAQDQDLDTVENLLKEYESEVLESSRRIAGRGRVNDELRAKTAVNFAATYNQLKGDYRTQQWNPGLKGSFEYGFSDYFGTALSLGYQRLGESKYFVSDFYTSELDLEYRVLPYHHFTPYFSGGGGAIVRKNEAKKLKFKLQFGGGLEYMVNSVFGFQGFVNYHIGFDDDWDDMVSGKRKDHFIQLGVGVRINLGNEQGKE